MKYGVTYIVRNETTIGSGIRGQRRRQEREYIRLDLQEGSRADDREANSQIFRQDAENEGLDTVEGSVSTETEK
jgi:hypothetical protein